MPNMYYGLIFSLILFAALLWSRNVLAKAGLLLQEKERKHANELLQSTMAMNIAVTIIYFICIFLAGIYFYAHLTWLGFLIPAFYLVLYVLINNRLYNRFFALGYPEAFCKMFVQSRVILIIGILIYGSYLLSRGQFFNNP